MGSGGNRKEKRNKNNRGRCYILAFVKAVLYVGWCCLIFAMVMPDTESFAVGLIMFFLMGVFPILCVEFLINFGKKICPYCSEKINKNAIKCPKCQSDLE